ncbi:MAG: acyltransferase [Catenulispora sp.]|nr:acyltransferase [Catenulispora sp.]
MTVAALPRQRRHTLHFLAGVRQFAPVFLDTEVDMTEVLAHRDRAREDGVRYSVVSYVLYGAARVLVAHPEANAAISGRLRPRIARYPSAAGKVAFDRTVDGHRVVLTAVLPALERAPLEQIQRGLERYRDAEPADGFPGALAMHRLPVPLGRTLLRGALRSLRRRPALMGTFAVSSLGHRPVDGFYSVGGTTITLGLGRIAPRPVVVGDQVAIRPAMRLSLAFDHRVVDGAEAADVLGDLKDALEHFDTSADATAGALAAGSTDGSTDAARPPAANGTPRPSANGRPPKPLTLVPDQRDDRDERDDRNPEGS